MKKEICSMQKIKVIDKFLSAKNRRKIERISDEMGYSVFKSNKLWRVHDGISLKSEDFEEVDYFPEVKNLLVQLFNACGITERDLEGIDYSFFQYPAGSAINWHKDAYANISFIYYFHPEWEQEWGGDLMLDWGNGTAYGVLPVPNRMVIFDGLTRHAVKRVEPFAKTPRLSIFGNLYLKKEWGGFL